MKVCLLGRVAVVNDITDGLGVKQQEAQDAT